MKTKTFLHFFSVMALGLIGLMGCTAPLVTVSSIPMASTTPSLLPGPTTISRTIMPTIVPALLPEKELQLAKALKSADCNLPCYLGITPGETSLEEARAILENLGGHYEGAFQRIKTDGAFSYTYQFHIGDPVTEKKIVYASVSLITDDQVVQLIQDTGAGTALPRLELKSVMVYREYWHKYYSAWQIFQQLGEPHQIYTLHRSNTLILFYENPDIKIEIVGAEQETNLCPTDQLVHNYYLLVNMTISNTNSPFSIDGAGDVPLTDHEVYFPIEETFSVTAHEFYEQVLLDPSICFEAKVSYP